MTTTSDAPQFLDTLEAELVRGARRRARRRARLRVAATATAVAVVAVAFVPMGGGGNWTRPALAIERTNGSIEIRLLHGDANPEQVKAELEKAGIPARVTAVPSTPSGVGRWLTMALPEGAEIQDNGTLLRVPPTAAFVELNYGRDPEDGEAYAVVKEAFHRGEPLHCSGVHEMSPVEADREIRSMGYRVEWFNLVAPDSDDAKVEHVAEPPALGVVVDGVLRSPDVITMSVTSGENRSFIRLKHAGIDFECTGRWPEGVRRPPH